MSDIFFFYVIGLPQMTPGNRKFLHLLVYQNDRYDQENGKQADYDQKKNQLTTLALYLQLIGSIYHRKHTRNLDGT